MCVYVSFKRLSVIWENYKRGKTEGENVLGNTLILFFLHLLKRNWKLEFLLKAEWGGFLLPRRCALGFGGTT